MLCFSPGISSSAISTPFIYFEARITVSLLTPFSSAIRSQVLLLSIKFAFFCIAALAITAVRGFFGFILFAHQVVLLLRGQITPSQLVFANPSENFFSAFKRERYGGEINLRVFLEDGITIVSVNKCIAPDTHRRLYLFTSFCVCHIVDIHVRLHDFESQIPNDFRIQSKPTKRVFRFWVRLFGGLIRYFSHSPIR